MNAVFENMVRIGRVTAVDAQRRRARVMYENLGIPSGWLYVLQQGSASVSVPGDGGHSHVHTVSVEPDHAHDLAFDTEPAGRHAHDVGDGEPDGKHIHEYHDDPPDEDEADGEHYHDSSVSEEPDHAHGVKQRSEPAGRHSHEVTDREVPHHSHHGARVTQWMPALNSKVLVLYIPVFNGDGFILGGL